MYQKFGKRLFDITFSFLAIVLLSPLLLLIIILLLLTGEHRVFYFQTRIGHRNKPFKIWKFVTMLKDSPKMGTGTITLSNDPRVLPVGRILRFTKINELPQLFNVLCGQMSFVGPRPMVRKGWMRFDPEIRYRIYNQKPGITGISSLIFRDEASIVQKLGGDPTTIYTTIIFPTKAKLEMWYQENLSMITDLKIILLTAWSLPFPQNQLHRRWFKNLPDIPF
ncbi:MAG TPA: sugar transferase [Salinivirgaceae bacterium]|mgnify:CR=1 FL=1|nr:sugar transferase [Salinivirgaceae bacterium]